MAELIVSAVAAPVEHREPESLESPGYGPRRMQEQYLVGLHDALPLAAGSRVGMRSE